MLKIETTLEEMRAEDNYDWPEAFGFAGGQPNAYNCGVPEAIPGESCSTEPFGLDDVAEILGSVDGDNDGPSWVCVGRLTDGRHFTLRAGCDYTGWD